LPDSILSQRMPRIDALTGLRWYAAFFVFTYHMLVFAPLPGIVSAFLHQGFFGVTFFFVLSGFVLTWSASPTVSQSTFYWRRFARIWPAHIVALILAIPVFYSFDPDPAQTWVKPVSVGILALSVVLFQGWSLNPTILFSGNPAAWTLTTEAFFYAMHPYLAKILMPRRLVGSLVFIGVVVTIAFGYRALAASSPGEWFAALPYPLVRLTEFAVGMGLAWAMRNGWRPRIPVSLGIGSVVVVLAAIVLVPALRPGGLPANLVQTFSNELVTVACALAILAVANRSLAGRPSILARKFHVRLGEWSFTFYLVHATFIYIVLSVFGAQPASWFNVVWFAVLLAFDITVAAALHYLVEKPVERRLRTWKDARAARAVEKALAA
jgi:peptidoglycan/LPS O-acetylase OafA/YrhL